MITLKDIDSGIIANNLESSNLIHPGEMIKDEIESRGMTQKRLADMTGISMSALNEMLPQAFGKHKEKYCDVVEEKGY